MGIQFNVDYRDVRKHLTMLQGEFTRRYIEKVLNQLRLRGGMPDAILIGRNVPTPDRSVIGGVICRVSYEIPADQIIFQMKQSGHLFGGASPTWGSH